jgi:hypothetical protein
LISRLTPYDHAGRLRFDDRSSSTGTASTFVFDLGGSLKRKNIDKFDHQEATDVFVEVKSHSRAGGLLSEYREFLRRAAIASSETRYRDAWLCSFSDFRTNG